MRPDNGAVDHLNALADAPGLVQGFQQEIPQSGERPAPELSIDRRPLAEMLVQIAPLRAGAGEPENPIENEPVILRPSPAMRAADRHEWLKARPFLIRHQSPKATLNVWPAPSARGDSHLALVSPLQRIRSRVLSPAKMEIRTARSS
jgi:hypothetical protein